MEHNQSNRGPLLLGINITAVILAGITCLLRCYVRLFTIKAFGLDDWLMVISTVRTNKLIPYEWVMSTDS
jgi:type IV secretory pathway TrbD component